MADRHRPRARRGARAALAAIAITIAGAVLADSALDQARRLLAARDPQGAFALLLPLESQRAGEVEYDYLLGIAALDAGDAQRAVFALERVLALRPDFLQARAEIARAYFVLGERENARREFAALAARQDVPPAARDTIGRYLSAIAPLRAEARGFVEASYGFDTNVNSSTSLSQIALPAFGGALGTLDTAAIRKRDSFFGMTAGISGRHPLSESLALVGNVLGSTRTNRHEDRFDTSTVDLSGGIRWTLGQHALTVAAQGQTFQLDAGRFRDSIGGVVQWQFTADESRQISAFYQFAQLRYPTQPVRDADRRIVGLAYAHAIGWPLQGVVFSSVYGGFEKAREVRFANLGHHPVGLRLGSQITLAERWESFIVASHEHRRYDADEPLFLTRRVDRQSDVRLGVSHRFARDWSVTPSVTYTDNRSSIELNRYGRILFSLSVRRDF